MTAISSTPGAAQGPATRGFFIDGAETKAASHEQPEQIDVHNPATGEVIARIAHGTAPDIARAIQSARRAFEGKEWGGMDLRSRARLVNHLADALEARLPDLFRLETT